VSRRDARLLIRRPLAASGLKVSLLALGEDLVKGGRTEPLWRVACQSAASGVNKQDINDQMFTQIKNYQKYY